MSSPPSQKVRVSVRPATYVLDTGLSPDEWNAMTAEERESLVYDATDELCKFETSYEVVP